MKSTYEIKRYKNSRSPHIDKALKLYSENIEPEYRTDTREILYWVDKFQERFGDSFYILGLYLNDILIGYAQMAYFREEKFVEVDYLVIDKPYRKNNAFYEFIDKIGGFLSEENIVYDYIICEVGCYFENREPTENSKTLIRLLKMSHFGVIKCAYYVPRLGKQNYESQMRAILMIYSSDELKQIKKETYLMIIKTLLYKYYQRWYNDFFNDMEQMEYQEVLDDLFEKIKIDVERRKVIEINGYHNLLPLNPTDFNEIKARRGLKIATFLIIAILSTFIIGGIGLIINKKWNIGIDIQIEIITAGVILGTILTSAFFENKSDFFSNILDKIINKK